MNHLTEEQLIEHYLGEGGNRVVVETHLRICSRCEQAYEEICNAMGVRAPEPPPREPDTASESGSQFEGSCCRSRQSRRAATFSWPSLCWPVLACSDLPQRLSGDRYGKDAQASIAATNPAQQKERVVLVILGDHLDRSERLLVQLNHAGADQGDLDSSLQAEARQLLPDNRLYRQAVSAEGDPMVTAALEHLERVLLELANSPERLNSSSIARIEREMNTDSLLFQIRVLRAQELASGARVQSSLKGASI